VDRHLAGGRHLGRAREPFDLRDQGEVRNELTGATEVAGGDCTDQAGYGSPQRLGSRDGQLAGAVHMPRAERVLADLQAIEDLGLHRLCTADNDPYLLGPSRLREGMSDG